MFYTIENNKLKVEVSTIGATLIKFIEKESNTDIVLGFDSEQEYLDNISKYLGSTVARNCNRIGKGKYTLNGKEYQMKINDGENNLHSGDGVHASEFTVSDKKYDSITLSIDMPDGKDGFPGNCNLKVNYALVDNKLVITFTGICDQDTLFNVTNHAYFNLDGGNNSALDHELMIYTNKVAVNTPDTMALEDYRIVDNTPFDFREFKKLGDNLKISDDNLSGGGIDHSYVYENMDFKKLVTVRNDKFALTISSDLPDMQVYTSNFLGDVKGKYGYEYHKFQGIAMEPQYFPNAINLKQYIKPILKANTEVVHKIEYQLEKR